MSDILILGLLIGLSLVLLFKAWKEWR